MNSVAGTPEKRTLGKTDVEVTSFGLGGEGLLRTFSRLPEGVELIWRALELGVTFFDCAHDFAASEDYYGAVWGEHPRLRQNVFLSSKSAQRTKLGARRELEMTLRRMHVDHLDLWQVQDVHSQEDWEAVTGPGGALEAFVQAYQAGLVRFIGVSGQRDPGVLEQAINEFEFHALSIPVNAAEERLGGFTDRLLPAAVERGIGVIGTKVLGGGALVSLGLPTGALIRYALDKPISVAVVDCDSVEQLEKSLAEAQQPFSSEDQEVLDAAEYDPEEAAYYRGTLKNVKFMEENP
jgi:aryl-alcohol dehydrogenase-like predicted oxidoreductase